MNPFYTASTSTARITLSFKRIAVCLLFLTPLTSKSQAVSGIITDYQGYWKSSATSINSVKPQNYHNLLAFTYNGTTYSTGVNDPLLTSKGESFVSNDFWSLPAGTISGAVNGNTKIGLGQLCDGVDNGASNPAPQKNALSSYLTDGIKGLGLGTCVANLPAGSMTFNITQINPSTIGDGIPDILVTQVADPSNSADHYEFIDASGNIVGHTKDIVFTSITPVGNWTVDFYEASTQQLTLTSGYTNTDRPLRLWAADLSEFGITTSNYTTIRNFRIGLSGNSDVAFVAYSNKTFRASSISLPVTLTDFSATKVNETALLKWNTQSESNSSHFVIEKSYNGNSFYAIDSIEAAGYSGTTRNYSFTDKKLGAGTNYYRLRMVDLDGKTAYSLVVYVKAGKQSYLNIYPNPISSSATTTISYESAEGTETLKIYTTAGAVISQQNLARGSQQTKLSLSSLPKGIYYLVLQKGTEKETQKLLIN